MQQAETTGQLVYVVDDDASITRLIGLNLKARGYQVLEFQSGQAALAHFDTDRPDLVLLDLVMPEASGLEVAKSIRQKSAVPIIMLSVLANTSSKLVALDFGADDFITKPFRLEELLARVRAILRRSNHLPTHPASSNGSYRRGGLSIDLDGLKVISHQKQISLTPREWATLRTLLKNPGRIVTPQNLLSEINGAVKRTDGDNARTYITRLRKKLEPDPRHPRYILLERGFGYRLADSE